MSRLVALLVLFLLLAAALAGCAKKKNALRPDVPPETTVFVQFTPGTGHDVNHLVHLYWYGTDPDGDVVAFDFRFVYPGDLPDTVTWHRTTSKDSIFAVYTPNGISTPTFEVRAIDNAGLVDETPASQTFSFTNQPPTVTVGKRKLTDTTFASVTLNWSAGDIDGDPGKMRFRVWLDGRAANPHETLARTYTMPTADFFEPDGHLHARFRTAYVQPIDDGGMLGAPDSTSWYVRTPVDGDHGRLLLIDDVTARVGGGLTYDTLYTSTASRNLPGHYTKLIATNFQPFGSALDVSQTFGLFDAVIWYRGARSDTQGFSGPIQSGIESYLLAGGRFMLESLNSIAGHNAPGMLSEYFATRYLDCDLMYGAPIAGLLDSTVTWTVNSQRLLFNFQPPEPDTLRTIITMVGARGFGVRDTNEVALWAMPGTLQPANDVPMAVTVSVPADPANPAGGRFTVSSVSLRASHGGPSTPPIPNTGEAHRVLAKLFKLMGLAP
jgi:hypothetical protein